MLKHNLHDSHPPVNHQMPLFIDGYNLLHAVGIIGRGVGPGGLERSRLALLNFLAESLEPKELAATTVVFDSREPPPGAPRALDHRGIKVLFSVGYADADAMLDELIRAHSAPRRLTVVSSDHQVQRSARRRKARAVDSDIWYAEVIRSRRDRQTREVPKPSKPGVPLLVEDVDRWLRRFGGEESLRQLVEEEEGVLRTQPSAGQGPHQPTAPKPAADKLSSDEAAEIGNPFPPGYGEDLLEDE
jgi:uncharacterized protein